ncbi:RHS repeat domain-containing protein [Pedobacter psychroterrae]|uniref:YD repeat-containing protein n=1 Tax=Pedobacter psychroterrae TaxID=2530453 RepID=A0A4R0NKC3_9SPHI|nr:hypothetical protein [Pedobacter psychroterrae]TCC99783.1 hypothetical protein EZ437_16205 [Pedobacter psychroterrae]
MSISYYDDYNFPGGNPYPYAGSDASGMTRGQLTGSKTAVVGTVSDMLWGVNYYDAEGRVVRSFKQHYKGGLVVAGNYDEVSNTYDFTGAVLTSNRSHKVGGTETLKSLTEYTYDHRGRKIDTWQTMNTGTRTLLSRLEYDDLGQPYKKKLHSTNSGSTFLQTVTYSYNERGWLRTASAPLLSFELRYDVPTRGGVSQYNGNISEFEYTAPTSGNKWFTYGYDNINRLLQSTYSTASELNETLVYDKNGNITSLRRGLSSSTPISYTYASSGNSNQLSSVSGLMAGSFAYVKTVMPRQMG